MFETSYYCVRTPLWIRWMWEVERLTLPFPWPKHSAHWSSNVELRSEPNRKSDTNIKVFVPNARQMQTQIKICVKHPGANESPPFPFPWQNLRAFRSSSLHFRKRFSRKPDTNIEIIVQKLIAKAIPYQHLRYNFRGKWGPDLFISWTKSLSSLELKLAFAIEILEQSRHQYFC